MNKPTGTQTDIVCDASCLNSETQLPSAYLLCRYHNVKTCTQHNSRDFSRNIDTLFSSLYVLFFSPFCHHCKSL